MVVACRLVGVEWNDGSDSGWLRVSKPFFKSKVRSSEGGLWSASSMISDLESLQCQRGCSLTRLLLPGGRLYHFWPQEGLENGESEDVIKLQHLTDFHNTGIKDKLYDSRIDDVRVKRCHASRYGLTLLYLRLSFPASTANLPQIIQWYYRKTPLI